MKNLFVLLIALLIFGKVNCQDNNNALLSKSDVNLWVKDNFAKNKIPPFSFVYGGKNSDTFITKWEFNAFEKESEDSNIVETVYTYKDRISGLVVECLVSTFKDFPAVEWVLNFKNNSNLNTPVIEKVNAVNQIFSYNKNGSIILHHANGCNTDRSDFRPYDTELMIGNSIYMTPDGGRSSSGNMAFPFFNIESPANEKGVMVAIGWTGKWYADVQQKDEKSVSLESGMERMHLILFPKEEIRTPKICLLFWNGKDRMIGHNQFRQFILAHHTHKVNGELPKLPIAAMLARGGPSPCVEFTCTTESIAMATINRHKQFNIIPEVFWLDAGWYPNNGNWNNTGSWVVNKENFPNGLKPISDAIHSIGAKFLLWFEPERVVKGTQIFTEHPEWVTELPNTHNALFNLGNKDAREWLTNHISDIILNEGIDIYRQDFNMNPMPFWEKADQPERIGISEIRHVEGLYAFFDSLLVRFPSLIIDNCASGGKRLDLETISRSSPFWRTDYHGYEFPNGSQDNTYGLNFYLPLHGTGFFERSTYFFRSNLGSSMVLDWNIDSKDYTLAESRNYIQDFKRLRPYFYGDYYPLTGTDNILKDNTWLSYQLNRPRQGDGIILAFRRDASMEGSIQLQLRGLDEKATYECFYEDYGFKINKTGNELMEGMDIYIPEKPASCLISYKKIL